MKDSHDAHSSTHLFVRAFMPSVASVAGGLFISIVLVLLHVLFFSLDKGSFTPGLASNQWIETYTDFIIHPVELAIHNPLLNTILTAILWGLVGLAIYSLLEAIINLFILVEEDERDVHVVNSHKIQTHPLRQSLLIRGAWRLFIAITAVLLTVMTGKLTHQLLVDLDNSLSGTSVIGIIYHIILTIIALAVIIHFFIILLRLYVFRTRVLGEVIH